MKKKQSHDVSTESLEQQIAEYKEKYLRALADYQNLEKRVQEERLIHMQYATKQLVGKLLPAIDALEKAGEHIANDGLHLALRALHEGLRSEGIEKFSVLAKSYDPSCMECVEVVENGKENEVVEEITPGYTIKNTVIRPAKVKVGKKKEKTDVEHIQTVS